MISVNEQKTQWFRKVTVFLLGQSVSLFGSQIVQMSIIWYVALEVSSGIWVTILTISSFLPQMIMSLFAGVWADRYNRKLIIILSDSIIAVATLFLALFMMSGKMGIAVLLEITIVSIIRSIGGGLQIPAVNAILPQMVPEDRLMRVNGFNGSIQSFVQFVSPLVAGGIMSVGPIYNILLIDVGTAIIGVSSLAMLKIPKHQVARKEVETSVLTGMAEGFGFIWKHRFLKRLFLSYGIYIFLCVPSGFLTTLMIERTFGDKVIFLTVNETVGFAGAFIGGLLLGVTGGFKNRNKTLFLGMAINGVASFFVGFTDEFLLFVLLMFFSGIAIPAIQSGVFTLVQEKTEPSMMGRAFSLLNVMFTGFMLLGMTIFGPLADVLRIQSLVIICAILINLLGLSILMSRDFYRGGYMVK